MRSSTCACFRTAFFATVSLLSAGCVGGILDLSNDDSLQTVEVFEPFQEVVAVGSQQSIAIEGINGSIRVRGVTGTDQVVIDAVRRVRSDTRPDAEDHIDRLNVFVWRHSDQILVQTVQPDQAYQRTYEVDYTVSVPQQMVVVVFNANGPVELEGLTSSCWIESLNGDVRLEQLEGSSWVDLANGSVEADIRLPPGGEISYRVGNGGALLRVQRDASAELFATVANGSIDVTGLDFARRASGPRTFEGLLGVGEGHIELSVENGWIEVRGR
jgi:hypothetical protein